MEVLPEVDCEEDLTITDDEERDLESSLSNIRITPTITHIHKERAPQKYLALEEKLKRHPKLASHLL